MDPLVVDGLRNSYRGARVFVTGDTGFKGSWLALALVELGAEVHGMALPAERAEDHFETAGLAGIIGHRDGDLRERAPIADLLRTVQPTIVFHLAAQPLVRRSYEDPKRTFDTNVGGSVNLLEAVRHTPSVRSLVFVTSDKCYRNKEWPWGYRENDELGGDDPYSASKAAAELVFASYWASYFRARNGFGADSVRAGNVIGNGGDWSEDRLVPDCIRALASGREIVIRSPGSTRPWQHVLEPVFGYLRLGARVLAEPKKLSGAWNFGPKAEAVRTVKELTECIVRLWGSGVVEARHAPKNAPHEAGLLALNCDKAHHELGWSAQWTFEAALEKTVRWYKDVNEGAAPLVTTRAQIQSYLDGAHTP